MQRLLFEVRVPVGGGDIGVSQRWRNGATFKPPLASYEGRNGDAHKQTHNLACQEYDRLPRVTSEGDEVQVTLCPSEGGRWGDVIGPRWRDLNDHSQPWKNVVGWAPQIGWQQMFRPSSGTSTKGGVIAISWHSAQ